MRREQELKRQFKKRVELHKAAVEQVKKIDLLLANAAFAPDDYLDALKDDEIDPFVEDGPGGAEASSARNGESEKDLTPAEINKRDIDRKRKTIRLLWKREFDTRNATLGVTKVAPDGNFHPVFGLADDTGADDDGSREHSRASGDSPERRRHSPSARRPSLEFPSNSESAPSNGRRLSILGAEEVVDVLEGHETEHGFVDIAAEMTEKQNDPGALADAYRGLAIDEPPAFCSNTLPPILETVCRDADQVVSASDNILKHLESQQKRIGLLGGELERMDYHGRRASIWMHEASKHMSEYVEGQEWIRRGSVLETTAQRREYLNVLEEVEMLERMCDKKATENASMRKRIDGFHKNMERAKFALRPKKHLQSDDLGWREAISRIRNVLLSCRLELSGIETHPAQIERIGRTKVERTQIAITHLLDALAPKDFEALKQSMCCSAPS